MQCTIKKISLLSYVCLIPLSVNKIYNIFIFSPLLIDLKGLVQDLHEKSILWRRKTTVWKPNGILRKLVPERPSMVEYVDVLGLLRYWIQRFVLKTEKGSHKALRNFQPRFELVKYLHVESFSLLLFSDLVMHWPLQCRWMHGEMSARFGSQLSRKKLWN